VDHIEQLFKNKNGKVVYFYFDYKAPQTQTATSIAANLLKQLLSQSDSIPSQLESLYREQKGVDLGIVIQLLASAAERYSSIYAVFDALDECGDGHRKEILELFTKLQESGYSVLVSTRFHVSPESTLKDTCTLTIEADHTDLKSYITARLSGERNIKRNLMAKCLELASSVRGMYVQDFGIC
jgi:hypothetical protein